jgi:hypothetical protein
MKFKCRGCDKQWEFVGPTDPFYIGPSKKGPYCDVCYDEAEWILLIRPRKTFRRWLGDLIGGRS